MNSEAVQFSAAVPDDFEALAALRIAAMRESLERVGRFDVERARERLRKSFYPEATWIIQCGAERVGFYPFRESTDGSGFRLDHLYVHPSHQSRGIGSVVLARVIQQADE